MNADQIEFAPEARNDLHNPISYFYSHLAYLRLGLLMMYALQLIDACRLGNCIGSDILRGPRSPMLRSVAHIIDYDEIGAGFFDIGGPNKPASACLTKHPIEQISDVVAKAACEKSVAGN